MSLVPLSQTLFRTLEPHIDPRAVCPGRDPYGYVASAIDQALERLTTERELFGRPERRLFRDVRWCFPLSRQAGVWSLIASWVPRVDAELESLRRAGFDGSGNPLRCPVYTRRGTPCERPPLPANGYCPSHQHLVVDDELQVA